MPRFSIPFAHIAPDGSLVTGIACGRAPRRNCSTPGCTGAGTHQCDFPVRRATATRTASAATCDRWMCRRCRVNVGPDRDYCRPHARTLPRQEPLALPEPRGEKR